MLELLSLRKGTALTKEMFLNLLYGGWTSQNRHALVAKHPTKTGDSGEGVSVE